MKKNVLIVSVAPSTFAKIEPVLSRRDFDVDRFPRGQSALELTREVAFDVIIVHYPLPGMGMQEFLDALRGESSSCCRSAVVLLTLDQTKERAKKFIGRGANRVLDLEVGEQVLQDSVASLLSVAQRVSVRIMAKVEVQIAAGRKLFLCQTENVSRTGMLLCTDERYPLGTILIVEFLLPEGHGGITGRTEVMRHTQLGRETTCGVGLRFVSFEGDGERKLGSFIRSILGPDKDS